MDYLIRCQTQHDVIEDYLFGSLEGALEEIKRLIMEDDFSPCEIELYSSVFFTTDVTINIKN